MRDRNKGIHSFILELEREKNRERVSREKAVREEFLNRERAFREEFLGQDFIRSTEPLPTSQVDPQESDVKVVEHVEIGNRGIEPFEAGVFECKPKGYHLETKLGISSALAACSFISVIVLLQIDALMNQNLYSSGLQIFKGAIPYWIAINTALGMLWLMIIAAMLFRMHVSTPRQMIMGERTIENECHK